MHSSNSCWFRAKRKGSWGVLKASVWETSVSESALIQDPVQETLPVLLGSHSSESRGKCPVYSHVSVSHLEATTELLFKNMSPALVTTPCLSVIEWLYDHKTPRNHRATFSEILFSPSLFTVLKHSCHPLLHIKT